MSVSELKPFLGSREPENAHRVVRARERNRDVVGVRIEKVGPAGNVKSGVTAPGRLAKLGVAIKKCVLAVDGVFGN